MGRGLVLTWTNLVNSTALYAYFIKVILITILSLQLWLITDGSTRDIATRTISITNPSPCLLTFSLPTRRDVLVFQPGVPQRTGADAAQVPAGHRLRAE